MGREDRGHANEFPWLSLSNSILQAQSLTHPTALAKANTTRQERPGRCAFRSAGTALASRVPLDQSACEVIECRREMCLGFRAHRVA